MIGRALEIYSQEGTRQLVCSTKNYIKWKSGLILRYAHNQISNMRYSYEFQNVMNQDWDNLIILDGCRYDLFEEINTISGDLEKKTFLWLINR